MIKRFRQQLLTGIAAFLLCLPLVSHANVVEETPSALAMTGDALFARPTLLAMTLVGSVVYVASLPFSLLGNNAGEAAEVLVLGPAEATFVRCLGCSSSGRKADVVTNEE